MSIYQFDVMIIGCGVAGLSAAITLAEKKYKIGVITRAQDPHHSNTFYAQGGIILPLPNDQLLISDIDKASAYTANLAAAELIVKYGESCIHNLLINKAQTSFERDEKGNLKFTKEAAHSTERILYKGDYTGQEIEKSLLNYLNDKKRFPNVSILTSHTAIDLLTPIHHGQSLRQRYEPDRIVGAYLYHQTTETVIKAMASITILATGGISALYLHHSNSDGARGDGHAMARRAGAVTTDMEFTQFHPTTFYDSSGHRRFLISEAIRGEGGRLMDASGRSFMEKYHPDCELAPRDVVSRAIVEEMIQSTHECVYLDISHKSSDWIKQRFPTIYKHCLEKRIDITQEPIPVVPAAHYTCGGVKTDLEGKTNLPGLYAVGEVACTGLHGANRLASTSLCEGIVFGELAAESIHKNIDQFKMYPPGNIKDWESGNDQVDSALVQQDWMTLRSTMWNYVGLIRTHKRLLRAEAMFGELYHEIQLFYRSAKLSDALIGLRNGVEVALHVVHASKRNKESIGCFYRRD